jgi:hypothetical protein
MAKTKMMQQVTTLLGQCKTAIGAVEKSIEYAQQLYMKQDPKALVAVKSVNAGLKVYEAAVTSLDQDLGKLEAHLAKWNADTKLKNIFKDKAKLRASKQAADVFVTQTKADVRALKDAAATVRDVANKIEIDM